MKTIIVNGRTKNWHKDKITFIEVVLLAFQFYPENSGVGITITYKDKKSSGSMFAEDEIQVNEEMIFNAIVTNKA